MYVTVVSIHLSRPNTAVGPIYKNVVVIVDLHKCLSYFLNVQVLENFQKLLS